MIIILIGTRAQIIKMAPVMLELERRKFPYIFILSGQHQHTMDKLVADFGIATTPIYLYKGKEVDSIARVPAWFLTCLFSFLKLKRKNSISLDNTGNIMLVHGDTFSTLLGAIIARTTGLKLAHIEAGLRSFNFLHPFPEELTRLTIFRLSDISYCPGDFALANMSRYKSHNVNTFHNTLLDSISLVLTNTRIDSAYEPDYCVCSLHRFENIFFRKRLTRIIDQLEAVSASMKIKFVLHPSTRKRLIKYNLYERISGNAAIELLDRMNYTDFIRLLAKSAFVITDGGSNQEELYYMGKPTLLMRSHTERTEGLSSTTLLSSYDQDTINRFVREYKKFRKDNPLTGTEISPSSIIVDHLQSLR